MATVYVIYSPKDSHFVYQTLLRELPCNGYHHWLSKDHLTDTGPGISAIAKAMDQCQAIIIVLSRASTAADLSEEINIALASKLIRVVFQIEELSEQAAAQFPKQLWSLLKIDFTIEGEAESKRLLVNLLPPVEDAEGEDIIPAQAERIDWNEEIFTASITRATQQHDHARAVSLVTAIGNHLKNRPYPYPSNHAYTDLQKLRQEREFELMRRYAEKVIASGMREDSVLRLYSQALIETAQYDPALETLQSIINNSDSSQKEIFEARGLMGRIFKQRYVNNPTAKMAASEIMQAIQTYETAYVEDQRNFWHGVNAASCILRAERDGVMPIRAGRARQIAKQILHDLEQIEQESPLQVWDCASKVEALLALDLYEEAAIALEVYLHHPDMTAFEVSSTFRQFYQVLQLDRNPRGMIILDRLRKVMERYRGGESMIRSSITPQRGSDSKKFVTLSDETINYSFDERKNVSLIIRVTDPGWQPDIENLKIQSRLGKIITARGSQSTIPELLVDPAVISIDESRPVGKAECNLSIPYIKATGQYTNATGTYEERGDAALIAVIDNSIDVLHEAFLDTNGKTRIVGIWDQTAASGSGNPPNGFTYGVFHDQAAIDQYIINGAVPKSLENNIQGHGTHVASIAAGRAAGAFAGGVAPEAKLLIVIPANNGPIGYSSCHIEALAFIDAFATKLGLPVVVNVSQGMNAGAHDGKSALEVAFNSFSESGRKAGRVIVKSAGNERDKNGHAKVTMMSNGLEQLFWRRRPGADFSERIELWWSSADEIKFRLRQPIPAGTQLPHPDAPGNWSDWTGNAMPECSGKFSTGGPYRMVFTKRHVDNGDSHLLIELGDLTGEAGFGDWTLEMHSDTIRENGEIHCWIERNRGLPTLFINHGDEEITLSIPGTAESVIAVGAVGSGSPVKVGAFSSYGPTRDGGKKPLICAPGVNINAAAGGSKNGAFLQSGTSMAAPHVSGAIALLLSRAAKTNRVLSGSQITSALRQKTQNSNGRWDRGQGYGVIDVAALLAAFD
jgi:endonuclease G